MTTHIFKSTDTGAPALSGQAGKLIDLLDAILLNGYNSQTVTSVTRSGAVATVTKTAHGYRDGALLVHSGADQTEYNVKAKVTVVDANTYSYPVSGTPATPATGTITAKVAPVGWTKEFSGTNKAVYRPPQGNRFYVRVLDDGSDAANGARVANFRAYETMSDVDTGTGDFPTVAQMTAGEFVSKSSTLDAVSRPWMLWADEKRLVVLNAYYSAYTDSYNHWCFGDLVGASSADAYATLAYGCSTSANANSSTVGGSAGRGEITYAASATASYLARAAGGAAGSIGSLSAMPFASTNGSGFSTFDAALANGDISIDEIQICNGIASTNAPRGLFPWARFVRNNMSNSASYPTGMKIGDYEVVRVGSSNRAYLMYTGDLD